MNETPYEDPIAAGFKRRRAEDPICYYSVSQDAYVHQDPETRKWQVLSDKYHTDYLKGKMGLANAVGDSENGGLLSDCDFDKMESRDKRSIEAALDFDGLLQGEVVLSGKLYINIGGTTLPLPKKGSFPATQEILAGFFDSPESDAGLVFQDTVRQSYFDITTMEITPKFPIITIGPSRDEGVIFHDLFALFLGGRSCHFTPKSDSKILLASALWRIDKVPVFSRVKTKAVFLDQFLTKNEVFVRSKQEQSSIPCFAQKCIFLEKNSWDLLGLQELSTSYKIHVLPLSSLGNRQFDFESVRQEIPAFMTYLLQEFKLPNRLRGKYIAPGLSELLFEVSSTGQFWRWLQDALYRNHSGISLQRIEDLQTLYSTLPMGDTIRDVIKKDGVHIPVYMEGICQRYPEKVRRTGKDIWKFNLPEQQDDEPSNNLGNDH